MIWIATNVIKYLQNKTKNTYVNLFLKSPQISRIFAKIIPFENETLHHNASFYTAKHTISGNSLYKRISKYQKYRIGSGGFGY